MGETANRIEDVKKKRAADDTVLAEARHRRNEVLRICRGFPGVLGTFASGSVAMGVVIDPVEDADGGMILDRRCYPNLGPDGDGDTPIEVVGDLHEFLGPQVREIWPKTTVHDMKRGVTVRMHEPVLGDQDPYVDVVLAMYRRNAAGLWIPNLAARCWDASHPQYHVELMTSGGRTLRRTRAQTVRLGKVHNKQYSAPALSSFNIVALVLEAIDSAMPIEEALHRYFEHAAASLGVRRTEDPAGVSGPIKLETTKDVAVSRLAQARDHLAVALAANDDPEVVAAELHQVFWTVLPEPTVVSSKAEVAGLLRNGTPRFRSTASGLAVAGAVTAKRSYGGVRG